MMQPNHPRVTRRLVLIQSLLGLGAYGFLALPYLHRTHGLERLRPEQRYLLADE